LRTKLLAAVGALAVCGAVALPGVAGAGPAAKAAKTRVTIKYNGDGFEGKLKSSKAKCIKNRTVKVFKKNGQKLYSDTTEDDGSWNTGTSGQIHGRFYAHTGRKPGCKPGTSQTIHT
jgi:hypothetical protein